MELADIINKIAKISLINIFTYIVFIKIIDYKGNNYKKVFIVCIASFIEAIVGRVLNNYIMTLPIMLIIYFIHSAITAKLTKNKLQYSIIVTFVALTITYLTYTISVVLVAVIIRMLSLTIQINNTLSLVLITVIQSLILYKLLTIKRLRNGISFLKNKEKVNNIGIVGIAFVGISLLIYSKVGTNDNFWINTYLLAGIIIEAICMFVWIRRKITKYYKQKLKEKTIEELENEIKQKDLEISKILKENQNIATINHKYSNRIKSLEEISAQILSKPEIIEKMKVEFGTDFGDIQKQINKISEEYSKEMQENIKHEKQLVKTGIFGIDNILEYMKKEAEKSNIKFELKINANIKYMIENIIDQSKLETLLGDHIKDAIIAINHSNNTYRSILTIIAIIEDCYEICIYDTGIEFEIETLLNLGTKPITTHKETGGSGIGFMTTFQTLKETKASLIIEEKHEMNNTDYTKAVRIRFDGKNEYRISSYRAEKIKKQKTDNRIKIQEYHYKSIKN